mmetsp:Transcript_12621/g.23628  ORF Transcript_12621/g.23628 Transcript_12621/m.23628 type:complete len:159 (-) Transcript_12621:8-484(-)
MAQEQFIEIPTVFPESRSVWEVQRQYAFNLSYALSIILSDSRHLVNQESSIPTNQSQVEAEKASAEPEEPQVEVCIFCYQEFRGNKGLKQHLAKMHTNLAKLDECAVCGKWFTSKHAVKFHLQQVHQKATRVECKVCGKMIYNKYSLKKHMASVHPSE